MPGKKKEPGLSLPEGVDMRYFESEMLAFFDRGQMSQLQRWFVASGSRYKAEMLGNLMVARFGEKLAEILDSTPLPE